MSAVAGYWAADRNVGAVCDAMLAAQLIYGPDATDRIDSGKIALGRNLFRLLPEDALDLGPVSLRGGRAWLVADIRLDNRHEIEAALGIHRPAAASLADSALLAAAIERWNWGALDRLVGDYAFALFDGNEQSLHLVTDPLGQRPLFWTDRPGGFAFASMPSGLFAIDGMAPELDSDRLVRFLAAAPAEADQSFYRHIRRVEPGSIVACRDGRVTKRPWWRPRFAERRSTHFDDAVLEFRDLLDCAVSARLRGAERRVATHLSGGWDSSAVTATAARLLAPRGGTVDAFTSVPRPGANAGAPFHRFADERLQAAAVAARYPNIVQHFVAGNRESPIGDLDRYLSVFQRPMVNLCNHVWLARIRDEAHVRGHRVLLTGEIGNFTISTAPIALLADYVRRRDWRGWFREARALHAVGGARWRGIAAASFGPWSPSWAWSVAQRWSAAGAQSLQTLLTDEARGHLDSAGAAFSRRPPKNFRGATLAALRSLHFAEYHKGVLGGWGIDKRDPTADARIIEFMLSLPPEMLLFEGERRPLAHAALADRLPPAVLDENRKGYQAGDWHEGLTDDLESLRSMIEAMGEDADVSSLIDISAIDAMIADWPQDGWDRPAIMARYRNALLMAISAGHFVLASKGKAPTN